MAHCLKQKSAIKGLLIAALFFTAKTYACNWCCGTTFTSQNSCMGSIVPGINAGQIWRCKSRFVELTGATLWDSAVCQGSGPPPECTDPGYQNWDAFTNSCVDENGNSNDEQDNNGDGWPDGSDKDKDSDPDEDGEPNETDEDDDGDGVPDTEDPNPFSTPQYFEDADPNETPPQRGDLYIDEEGNVWEVTQDATCLFGNNNTCIFESYDTGLNDEPSPGNSYQQGTPGQGLTQETESSTQTNNGVTTETETSQTVNSDGSRTTTTTTTETYADGSSSVTTTTTTDYRNTMNNGGTRESSTTREIYDTQGNLTGSEQTGSSTQSYSDAQDEEGKSASGGTTCDREPSCSGDPILCAILRQQWLTRCADYGQYQPPTEVYEIPLGDDELALKQQEYRDLIDQIQSEFNSLFAISLNDGGGISAQIQNIRGVDVDFSILKYASLLNIIGLVIIAVAYIKAFFIIFSR